MAERPHIALVRIVAEIGREQPKDEDAAACEAAVDALVFLADECDQRECNHGEAARLAILDLAAAIVAFGGVRNIDELVQWLRKEAPARARELEKAVAASNGAFDDVQPCSCLGAPEPAIWH
jgi:hypothetical protein